MASDAMPPSHVCSYIYNTGVMMIEPLNASDFEQRVVQPWRRGDVHSYDGSDQGAINSLLYEFQLFNAREQARLHPRYNAVARWARHAEQSWGGQIRSAILHYTRESRPWLARPPAGNLTLSGQWVQGCGDGLCAARRNGYTQTWLHAVVSARHVQDVNASWSRYCA